MVFLSSMPSTVMGDKGDKMSHAARWMVGQYRRSGEMEAINGLRASMCD